jgi:hypothetical protein
MEQSPNTHKKRNIILGIIGGILVLYVIIHMMMPSTPTLHNSYNGTMTAANGVSSPLALSSINENSSGSFSASGFVGQNPATFQGSVTGNSISFTATNDVVGTFTGTTSDQGNDYTGTFHGPFNSTGTWSIT